ncbi:MAG: DUF3261 domain-containing protein [Kofleriaceae bacterium]
MSDAAVALALVFAIALPACGAAGPRRATVRTTDPSSYPCVLHAPGTLSPDFSVHQSLILRARRDGRPVEGELDAVVQKQGDTLLIVGLGPMNVRYFTLRHQGELIEFAQDAGPSLPVSPRDIVADVHRVFFKRLPAPAPDYTGVLEGVLDDEAVSETWQGGALRVREFTRPGSAFRGAVRVEFGAGCTAAACQPETVHLRNDWFDYTLELSNDSYEVLE